MKRETRLSKKIREGMKRDFGTILHKNHGGAFGETGAADLYGTLPGGRALYIETKAPDAKTAKGRMSYQLAWLRRERDLGAIAVSVTSYDELLGMLAYQGFFPK